MNKVRWAAFLILLLALVLIVWGFITGQVEVALIVFIPVLIGQGPLAALGMLLLFLAIVLFFLSIPLGLIPEEEEMKSGPQVGPAQTEVRKEFGGVIFIGPIPFVFGSGRELLNNRWFVASIVIIALILLAVTLVLLLI